MGDPVLGTSGRQEENEPGSCVLKSSHPSGT